MWELPWKWENFHKTQSEFLTWKTNCRGPWWTPYACKCNCHFVGQWVNIPSPTQTWTPPPNCQPSKVTTTSYQKRKFSLSYDDHPGRPLSYNDHHTKKKLLITWKSFFTTTIELRRPPRMTIQLRRPPYWKEFQKIY